jgi:hypothetical protein
LKGITMPRNTRFSLANFALAAIVFAGAIAFGAAATTASTASAASMGSAASTAGVQCTLHYSAMNSSAKVQATSSYNWACDSDRTLTANGIPDHDVTDGSFATPIGAQNIVVHFPLSPSLSSAKAKALDKTASGYALNGVKFDPGTAGTCASDATSTARGAGCDPARGRDSWSLEAIGGAFKFGTDSSNAHVQPNGQYHYHGMPVGYMARVNGGAEAMTLVGFAIDGFPIYARYGHASASDAASALVSVKPSYQKKAVADSGRPTTSTFPMGTFTQDYEYVAGSGDLDECNGRTGVTPEFPQGIYHYFITDSFPFIQRCVKGGV